MIKLIRSALVMALVVGAAIPRVHGQNGDPTPKTRQIPPSPEAANLGRYAASPPSYYSGTPQISVPLAEVVEGPIKVPLSLSYNASGNRVEDMASWVGLGWALNAGGVITRATRGAADDQQPSANVSGRFTNFFDVTRAFTYAALQNASLNGPSLQSDTDMLLRTSRGCADTQPDVFYFNFNGYTGQFSFDWNRQIQVSSDKDVRIEPVFNDTIVVIQGGARVPAGSIIEAWRVTTETGAVYRFAAAEYTNNRPVGSSPTGCIPPNGHRYISSWYLSSITDVNREHWVHFDYEPYQLSHGLRFNNSIENGIGECPGSSNSDAGIDRSSRSLLTVSGIRPRRIRTSSGNTQVELFPEATLRTDTVGLTGGRNSNLRALNRLVVRNAAGAEVKTLFLGYYPNHPTGRLTLRSVQEGRLSGPRLPAHVFSYNAAAHLPEDIRSLAQDHWGYYNGADGNVNSLVPGCSLPGQGNRVINVPGAMRDVDTVAAQAGILTRVDYPTGGHSLYSYESNEYGYINDATVASLGEFKKISVSYGVSAAGGEPGPPTSSTSAWKHFEHRRTFRVLPRQNPPVNTGGSGPGQADPRVLVTVTRSAFTCAGVNGHRPSIEIKDSLGARILWAQAGVCVPVNDQFVYMLAPGLYTLIAQADRRIGTTECDNTVSCTNSGMGVGGTGFDAADISVTFDSLITPTIKKIAGGLRVRRIQDFSRANDNQYSDKTFTYKEAGRPTGSSGCIYGEPNYAYLTQYMWTTPNDNPGFPDRAVICDCWLRIAHNRTSLGSTQGGLIGYREVTVTNRVAQQPYSQAVYKFTSPVDYPDQIEDRVPFPPATSQSHRTGLLQEQVDYLGVGSGQTRLRKVTTRYRFYEVRTPGFAVAFPNAPPLGSTFAGYMPIERVEYVTVSGHAQPDTVRETKYDASGTNAHVQESTFAYDPQGTRVRTEAQRLAANVRKLVSHWYSPDFPSASAGLYGRMANDLHVIVPVETLTIVERDNVASITGAVFHEFGFQGAKLRQLGERRLRASAPIPLAAYRPAADPGATGPDARLERYLAVDAYDRRGNVTQLHQPGDLPVARLWGYRHAQLLGEAVGASLSQVAATSFEPDSPGRWRYDDAGTVPDGHTGRWAYQLSAAPVVRDSLPAGAYQLTCWATAAPTITVNNGSVSSRAVSAADARGFRQYEARLDAVPVQATVNVTGSGLLDDLRLVPRTAQLVTYTYDPLVGMTSRTDPSGRTTTYEYDALGRLLRTRDEQGHILSQQQYHYARP